MLLHRFVSPALAANTYVLAQAGQALICDPGAATAPQIAEFLAEHELQVAAVILTHGHPDHVWDAAAVAGDQPVYVPGPDLYRLDDPLGTAGLPAGANVFATEFGAWQRPQQVVAMGAEWFSGGVQLAGIPLVAVPAPGHTEGSTVLLSAGQCTLTGVEDAAGQPVTTAQQLALTGDVIFASSVGRTDLLGGDERTMLATLRTLQMVIDPATCLLPGHGPATTMDTEIATNAHLRYARRVG